MSRFTVLLLVVALNAGSSYGMYCSLGHKKILSFMTDSCPEHLWHLDESYCCMDFEKNEMYCCDGLAFFLNSSWIIFIVIACLLVVISISYFCCRCCLCCNKRRQGTVYGRVQVPAVVHVIQSPASVQQAVPLTTAYTPPVYPISSTDNSHPLRYVDVVHEKQPPYNPGYVPVTNH